MTPEQWQEIERLYHAALERPREGRMAFLDQACAGEEDLRREVESLLAAHDTAESFIEAPPEDVIAGMVAEGQARSIVGRTLGHYRMESLLGVGGMGEVYRARDLRLGRPVAVKILPPHLADHPEALKRFEREVRAVAALSHTNILSIFDFGTEDGVSYAVMELLEGETLRARLHRGPLAWREALRVGLAVAEGLTAAHKKGIIHRDLKPENIFLTSTGQVKILDFGIARVKYPVVSDAETLTATLPRPTQPGMLVGTIGYMSPEQVRGETAEAPSDIFGLGCVLYEMLSGQRPFDRPTPAETMAAILREEPPALATKIPERLRQLTRHCLQKDTRTRFQSAHDLIAELNAMASGATSSQRGRQKRGGWMRTTITLAILLLVIALSLRVARRLRESPANRATATNPAPAALLPSRRTDRMEVLRYDLEVESNDAKAVRTTGSEPLASGQVFRFHFLAHQRGFLYIIGPGENNAPTAFLTGRPIPETGVTTNEIHAGAEFSFPAGTGNAIGLGQVGTVSTFTVLFAPGPIQAPAFLSGRANQQLAPGQLRELAALWRTAKIPEIVPESTGGSPGVTVQVAPEQWKTQPVIFEIAVKRKSP